jgi:uncharacterized protein (DUF697 family)
MNSLTLISLTSHAAPESDGWRGAVERSRKMLKRRALVAAAASAVPVPGLDWAVDAALLSNLIPAINREFGLAPEQLDQLDPSRREQVEKALAVVGSLLIGKFITRDLLLKAASTVGLRLTARQAAKLVPIAGQVASALMGYATIRYFGEMHIRDCVRATEQLHGA